MKKNSNLFSSRLCMSQRQTGKCPQHSLDTFSLHGPSLGALLEFKIPSAYGCFPSKYLETNNYIPWLHCLCLCSRNHHCCYSLATHSVFLASMFPISWVCAEEYPRWLVANLLQVKLNASILPPFLTLQITLGADGSLETVSSSPAQCLSPSLHSSLGDMGVVSQTL